MWPRIVTDVAWTSKDAVDVAMVGVVTGVSLALLAETGAPAAIGYYRFATGRWKSISRGSRPDTRSIVS